MPKPVFQWQIQGDLQALLVNNGSTVGSIPVSLTNGQWTHLALTIDDDTWTAYVDGVAADTITQTVSIPAKPAAPHRLCQRQQRLLQRPIR